MLRANNMAANQLLYSWSTGSGGTPAGLSFTGGAGRTYLDSNGALQSVGANVPRLNAYVRNSSSVLVPGWLLEGASTNHFLQSGTPATQTTSSLATGTYTVWLVGTGQIVVSAGTATITGAGTATAAAPVTFVVTVAGTVVYTVSGSPTRAQAENLSFPSSYIPTTTVAVTRSAEVASVSFPYAPMALSVYVKMVNTGTAQTGFGVFSIGNDANTAQTYYGLFNGAGSISARNNNGALAQSTGVIGSPVLGDQWEMLFTYDASGNAQSTGSIKGGAAVTNSLSGSNAPLSTFSASTLHLNANGTSITGYALFQSIKIARGVQSLAFCRSA